MQNSSAFQFLAVDTIHESTTNPRRTFEESKLQDLAESIRQHGIIQPITVRPNASGFELIAGARRFRAAKLAELFSIPARIVEIDDTQVLEWQLVENAQRADIHPYEEAQGFQRLLDLPVYDVATLVEKSGKSASHIYARLSLLQLIPEAAEAFIQERITASHAILIARCRRNRRPKPSNNAGAKTGRTAKRTCCQRKTSQHGFRTISILRCPMRHSTAKIPPLTPQPEPALLAHAAAATTQLSSVTCRETSVSYVEPGQPQVFPAGSPPPRSPREAKVVSWLFSLDLHQEVHVPFEFTVHPIRWDRCPLVASDPHAQAWLLLQSHRGLSSNTLDAYSRALERYLAFLKSARIASVAATRAEVGLYLAALQAGEVALANATIQQLLTVVRLFHGYLMEEGTRSNNPAAQSGSGRAMVARHQKLPWIPNE